MAQRTEVDVVVVGSGPNGLAAAVTMARAGLGVQVLEAEDTLGGGARTLDLQLTDVGVTHDICSAVHPLALASPFFEAFDLPSRGVGLTVPEVAYAQPLDGGRAGVAYHDLERTAVGLGRDGAAWRAFMTPLMRHQREVIAVSLSDKRSIPRELLSPGGIAGALTFGSRLLEQGSRAWNARFSDDEAPALLTGVSAHAIARMPAFAPAGTAIMLASLAHTVGWPLPVGGSQAITDAMLDDLRAHGGDVRTGVRVSDWRELPRARAYLFDTTPRTVLEVWKDRVPTAAASALGRFPHGPGAAKVDFVLDGPVPWTHPEVGAAGTIHVGGTRAQMAAAEEAVHRGRHAAAPMVLASDPSVVVPSREIAGLRPFWTYAHVPAGSTRDVTEDVTAQIERFAPGFRDVVVASRCVPAAEMAQHNANYVGGDIAAGAVTFYRMVARPTLRADPYAVGIPGVYLCSASTTPAPGVHGMNGWYAAGRALRARFGIRRTPDLSPGR
ncbi:dehydrogenase [Beutenbergia cavernae DSM 12333]|uniref:Dehydrogenase n=1 Tax=Beutenbergia cavernae (strain ATCC BAA-8 / DSM 12333 / CCUG 43141 / JCM 11478 / NBRC 16432 / NCIMB 13614 / HKI 0122) TaxID=471853 RepID=C5BZA7_BEUC1|nr:NAD(P)/FAD-dependent oxidoreductase [Beutenbergia cavernae]ACQ79079.1 dehydrogenase [Beutenbergia cavernae DSM 12333]